MKEKVRKLWELCFHDSPAFTDLYFQMRYNNEVNIAIQSGDLVIAALQMLPYPMTYCGKTIATSYVSGACTHPDFRNKGVMRELLAESFASERHLAIHSHSGRTMAVRLLRPKRIYDSLPLSDNNLSPNSRL